MSAFRTSFTAIAAAMLAVACGGGGGGDGGGSVIPPPPTDVLISAANQDAVARASVASIMPFVNVPVAPGAEQASAVAPGGLTQLALRSIKSSVRQSTPTADGMARPLALLQEDLPCAISGTFTAVLDDKDNNGTISAGDSISMLFNGCVDEIGSTINGGLGMAILSYSLSPVAEDMMEAMTFQALTLVDPTGSFSMSGGFSFTITVRQTADGSRLNGSYVIGSTGGLTVSKQGGSGGLPDTFTYNGYTVDVSTFIPSVSGARSETINANGKFRSDALGGELNLRTISGFTSNYTDATSEIYPLTGQLIATGRNNTALGLTATGTVQARMDMCDDGDGAWEASKMMPWDSLYQ